MRFYTISLLVFLLGIVPARGFQTEPFQLESGETLQWYKGNLHTHSLWSDGDDYPEMIAAWYKDHDYHFLVFTDHNVLHNRERWIDIDRNKGGRKAFSKLTDAFTGDWVETRTMEVGEGDKEEVREEVRLKMFDEVFERFAEPGKYLLIQGEEISDAFAGAPVHLCASHLAEVLPPMRGESLTETIQNNINAVIAYRERTGVTTMVHLNHPNFQYAITAEDMIPVVGERFFEVFNGHPSVHNTGNDQHASTERIWDIVNTFRLSQYDLPLMYGIATDDGHSYHVTEPGKGSQPGRGWVQVLADRLEPDTLVQALEKGAFYGSSGVELSHVSWRDNSLKLEIVPEDGVTYKIDFIGTRREFDSSSQPAVDDPAKADRVTRVYSKDIGEVFKSVTGTSAEYTCTGDELYVRAVVTSSMPHPNPSEAGDFQKAWVQPVVVTPAKTSSVD